MRYSLYKNNIQYESMTANKPKEGKIQTLKKSKWLLELARFYEFGF